MLSLMQPSIKVAFKRLIKKGLSLLNVNINLSLPPSLPPFLPPTFDMDPPGFVLKHNISRGTEALRFTILISLDMVLSLIDCCFSNNMKRKLPPTESSAVH